MSHLRSCNGLGAVKLFLAKLSCRFNLKFSVASDYISLLMTQLPRAIPYPVGLWRDAYNMCLDFESRSTLQNDPTSTFSPLVLSRFLGYMILEAPTDNGRTNFSNEVIACANDGSLKDIAMFYIIHFLWCCECQS